ncbi:MAG: hypothetical protein L3K03_08620, partial [Thermoplasmata archaeon]|nr:hypothetical protein [Thermoplasmata archaeon]
PTSATPRRTPSNSLPATAAGARCVGCGGVAAITHSCGAPLCHQCIRHFPRCPKCGLEVTGATSAPIAAHRISAGNRRPVGEPVVEHRPSASTAALHPRDPTPRPASHAHGAAPPAAPKANPPATKEPAPAAPTKEAPAEEPEIPPPRPPRPRRDDEPRL